MSESGGGRKEGGNQPAPLKVVRGYMDEYGKWVWEQFKQEPAQVAVSVDPKTNQPVCSVTMGYNFHLRPNRMLRTFLSDLHSRMRREDYFALRFTDQQTSNELEASYMVGDIDILREASIFRQGNSVAVSVAEGLDPRMSERVLWVAGNLLADGSFEWGLTMPLAQMKYDKLMENIPYKKYK